jgi:hypothetical protein
MKAFIKLFAAISAPFWLWNLIFHAIMGDTSLIELICCLVMFGISVWTYEWLREDPNEQDF